MSGLLLRLLLETCPDLFISNIPTHPEDFLWYAERVNGRIAMVTVVSVLVAEFVTKRSIFQLINLFN